MSQLLDDQPLGRAIKHAKSRQEIEDDLVQPGELACARFMKGQSPSATTRRAALLMLKEALPTADEQGKTHRITKRQLRGLHKGNERIQELVESVVATVFSIPYMSQRGRDSRLTMPLFSMINVEDADDEGAWVEYRINEEVRQLLLTSNIYAKLSLMVVAAFDSRYSITLYQLGATYCNRDHPYLRLTVPMLREQLGIPKTAYKDFAQIRNWVLKRAAAEINQMAHFEMSWTEFKQGRRITGIELCFLPKSAEGQREAASEAMRPKTGRKARRDGAVERLLPTNESGRPTFDLGGDDHIPWV